MTRLAAAGAVRGGRARRATGSARSPRPWARRVRTRWLVGAGRDRAPRRPDGARVAVRAAPSRVRGDAAPTPTPAPLPARTGRRARRRALVARRHPSARATRARPTSAPAEPVDGGAALAGLLRGSRAPPAAAPAGESALARPRLDWRHGARGDPRGRAHADRQVPGLVRRDPRGRARRRSPPSRPCAAPASRPSEVDQTIFGHARQAGQRPEHRPPGLRSAPACRRRSRAYNVNIACGSGHEGRPARRAADHARRRRGRAGRRHGEHDARAVPAGPMRHRLSDGRRHRRRRDVPRRAARPALRPHHGRDGREPRRPLRHLARGAGRVRAASPSRRRPAAPSGARARCSPSRSRSARGTRHGRARTSTPARTPRWSRSRALAPVFREGGSVTAGNSSGITDGAAAHGADERVARPRRGPRAARPHRRHELGGRATRRSWASGRSRPRKKVLERTGLSLADFDVIEINEAFAAQVIACERELKFDRDRLNVERRRDLARPSDRHERRPDHALAGLRDARPRRVARPGHALHLRRPGPGRRPRTRRAWEGAMSVHAVVLIQCEIDAIPEAAQAIADIDGVSRGLLGRRRVRPGRDRPRRRPRGPRAT